MGGQKELIERNYPTIQKRYRFTLSHATFGTLVLRHAPDGWKDDEFSMTRNMKYFGVFRKFSQSELKFIKEGRDYLQAVYEAYGVNAQVSIKVEYYSSLNVFSTRFEGTIDFSTWKINELTCAVQIKDGAFTDLILSRASQKVNIRDGFSVDGDVITPAALSSIEIPDINIGKNGLLRWVAPLLSTYEGSHVIPVSVEWGTFTELQTPAQALDDIAGAFFANAEAPGYVDLTIYIVFDIQLRSFNHDFDVKVKQWDGASWTEVFTDNRTISSAPYNQVYHYSSGAISVALATGDYLIAEFIDNNGTDDVNYQSAYVALSTTFANITGRTINGVTYREAWRAIVAKLTGNNSGINSTIFDDVHLGALIPGHYLRQNEGINDTFSFSLSELFDSLSLFNIGIGVDLGSLTIERMSHFFDANVIIDLSGRVSESLIEKSVIPELYANRIQIGFNSYTYNNTGGIYEYNTASIWSTVIKSIDSEFSIVSPFRADTTGIFDVLQETDDEKDMEVDEDIYMLDSVEGDTTDLLARTNEGFEQITGAVLSNQVFNVDYSPGHTLLRWGSYVRAMHQKNLQSFIRFQKSERNASLRSTLTGAAEVVESADILPSTLDGNLWINEAYSVEVPLRESDIAAIQLNPYGLVKLTDKKYGWILEFKSKNENRKSSYRLLRVNLDVVTPIPYIQLGFGMLYNWFTTHDLRQMTAIGWRIPNIVDLSLLFAYTDSSLFRWVTAGYRENDGDFVATDEIMTGKMMAYDEFDIKAENSASSNYSLWLNRLSYNSIEVLLKEFGLSARVCRTTSLNDGQTGQYTGNNGKVYGTVAIGGLEWLSENLAETKYRLIAIPLAVTDTVTEDYTVIMKIVTPNNGVWAFLGGIFGPAVNTAGMYGDLDQQIHDQNSWGAYSAGLLDVSYDGTNIYLYVPDGSYLNFIGDQQAIDCITVYTALTTEIPEITDGAAWAALTTGARCYFNNDSSNE